jgi:serine/threonine protein phosphatase PrpC
MRANPITDKYSFAIEDDKVKCGATTMQGWRHNMEDAHFVGLDIPALKNNCDPEEGALFAVFDGHNGYDIAHACAANILNWISGTDAFKKQRYSEALTTGFLKGDEWLREEMAGIDGGCTANVVLLVKGQLFCGNAGDTRAVLCRAGQAIDMSEDHKPSLPREKERIQKAGGFVCPQGRVYGVLALSRALGDFMFKQKEDLSPQAQPVTADPDVREVMLTKEDEFLIIACDGIWDVMTSQAAVDFVRNSLKEDEGDVSLAAEKLLGACLAKKPTEPGTDNMTAIIVKFKPELVKRYFPEDAHPDDEVDT